MLTSLLLAFWFSSVILPEKQQKFEKPKKNDAKQRKNGESRLEILKNVEI